MRFPRNVSDDGALWISALTGRSSGFEENDDDMPINREAPSLGQGAEWVKLDGIADPGLARCSREHIHLADVSSPDRKEVAMTILEKSAEILVTVDARVDRGDRCCIPTPTMGYRPL